MLFEIRWIYNRYSLLIDFITNHRKYEHLSLLSLRMCIPFLKLNMTWKLAPEHGYQYIILQFYYTLLHTWNSWSSHTVNREIFAPLCSCVWICRRQKLHKNSPACVQYYIVFLTWTYIWRFFFFNSLFYVHLFVMYWPVYLMFHFTWLWINA